MNKSAIYFTRAAPAAREGAVILSGHMIDQEADPSFTRPMNIFVDQSWGHSGDVRNDVVYGLATRPSTAVPGLTEIYALGRDATLWIKRPRQDPVEVKVPVREPWMYLENVCLASTGIYVCGGQRQVYRYSDGQWSAQDDGIYIPSTNGEPGPTLFSIIELKDMSLLVVGSGGFIATRPAGGAWTILDCPTNMDLLCALPDDQGIWISGRAGTLLYLSADMATWSDHSDENVSTANFDCLAHHGKRVYITARNDLLVTTKEGGIAVVQAPFKPDSEFHSVCTSGDYLFVTGDEHVYRLGPDGWVYLQCPDNT
ncbi:MAG: hypothetical protein FWD69_00690 [Polyangiaceae bacterium]|nr:hypothetical protein [Polyangiaceae bacterium]